MKILAESESFLNKEFNVNLTGLELLLVFSAYGSSNTNGMVRVLEDNSVKQAYIDQIRLMNTTKFYDELKTEVKRVMGV